MTAPTDAAAVLREAFARATPGPVVVRRIDRDNGSIDFEVWTESSKAYERHFTIYERYDARRAKQNAEFYASAHNHLPTLLSELDKLREREARLTEALTALASDEGFPYLTNSEKLKQRITFARAALQKEET